MSYRQNFRGRQDNRFRYNGPPGRGGRGGFGARNNAGVGGFIEQRRDTFPQHGRQQNQKPSVNAPKSNATSGNKMKTEQTSSTPKPKQDVQPLMDKELPKTNVKDEKPNEAGNAKVNAAEKATPTPNLPTSVTPTQSPTPVKKTPAAEFNKPAERSGQNKRPNTGYQGQGNQQNRSNHGGNVNQGAGRQSGSDRGRFDNRNNQERKPQTNNRFGSPGHGQFQRPTTSETQHPQPMQISHPDFGDDLVTEKRVEKKFTGRCRLFIGNLPNETTDDEFKKLFDKFGEINEVFLNKQKMFGFIRLDTRLNAEAAKNEMDGATFKGRVIRVRFAAHGAALKIKNLPAVVSNELVEEAFSNFGEVERAIVIVDDRGKSTSEGIVEFARKPAAQAAIKKIKEGVFLMTASTKPITVEPLEQKNDDDGLPEKNVPKNQTYYQEREAPPRFAQRNSFEYEWGQRWKQQAQEEENQRAKLEAKFVADREKIMEEVELARHDYHTMQMRQELLHRQKELERLEEQRKDLEARRQGLQRRREEQFVGQGMMDPGNLMRQQQQQEANMQMQQNLEMQQAMRGEDMSRRDADRFAPGGGNSGLQPPQLPPSLMMDSSEHKGMMGQNQDNMQNQQRQSRFDVGPGGVAFNGSGRGGMAAGAMGAEGLAQQENVMGVNFGALQGAAGMGNNPRPLMEDMTSEMMGDFANAKRARRF